MLIHLRQDFAIQYDYLCNLYWNGFYTVKSLKKDSSITRIISVCGPLKVRRNNFIWIHKCMKHIRVEYKLEFFTKGTTQY